MLAITVDGLLSQNPFLEATVRFSSEKYVSMSLKKAALAKNSANIFMDKYCIAYDVKIHVITFILCFS